MKPIYLHFLGALTLLGLSQSAIACSADIPSDVDTDSNAFQIVIDNDSFCCNVEWDQICQNAYNNLNPNSDCSADPGPNVDTESSAYLYVIADDPFCCNSQWDSVCQNTYNQAGGSTPDNNGDDDENNEVDCVTPPAGVDVDSPEYADVIANDAFCCNVQWDAICNNAYNNNNGSGNGGGNWGGGNNNGECIIPPANVDVDSDAYLDVIANDSFCCNVQWDAICNNAYNNYLAPGECVEPFSGVDTNSEAYAQVIAADSFCCDVQWDNICQNYYDDFLGPDECVQPYNNVDTESEAYATVIANDSFCCDVQWDNICQNAYEGLLGNDDGDDEEEDEEEEDEEEEENDSDCAANIPAGIDVNSEAFATVIANDSFCCNLQWDNICQNAYNNYLAPGGCVEPFSGVDSNSEAYAQVIAADSFCCDVQWDNICQNYYDEFLGPDECVQPYNNVDTESEAYATVIANDSFCCNVQWDNICQNAYEGLLGNDEEDEDEEGENDSDCAANIPAEVDVNSEAFATVIANYSFCCNVQWDGICQNAYEDNLNETNCVETPEIIDTSSPLYLQVIANDPFCCENQWDALCNNDYNYQFSGGCIDEEASNYNPSANVDDGSCEYGEGIINPQGPVQNALTSLDLNVFPNPTNGIAQVVFNGFSVEDTYMIRVHNATGQIIFEENVPAGAIAYRTEIDLSFAASGVYIVTAFGSDQITSKRLIKQY